MSASNREPIQVTDVTAVGKTVALDAEHARSLRLRGIQITEAFTLVDRDGVFFRASLKALGRQGGQALVYERMSGSTESPAHITLACAVLARQRMLTVVQKATELGVERIVPVLSDHSVQREGLAHEKAQAWPKQVLRAARQCRRASLPDVRPAVPLREALHEPWAEAANLSFYLDDRTAIRDALSDECSAQPRLVLWVGPEGGWSDVERELLVARGVVGIRLGGRVLRAETAVYAGLTLLQHAYGDM